VGVLMCWAVPEVCKRQRGSMHILALRRCAPAILLIRWRGNVLRLRRAAGRGARAAWGLVGSDPRGTGARFGLGAVRVFTPGPEPSKGRSPASDPCRKAVQINGRLTELDSNP